MSAARRSRERLRGLATNRGEKCGLAGCLALALAAVGCAAGGAPRGAPELGVAAASWALPREALGTQRLYRARYRGPEGEGGLKLTLRLTASDRFQLAAADRLGRPLWAIEVAAGRSLVVDHHGETFCRRPGGLELPGWSASPFSLAALPAVLLGAVPAAPPVSEEGPGWLRDRAGRRWSWQGDDGGRPHSWSLWQEGEVAWWWRREARGGVLASRDGAHQLQWEEQVAEPLSGPAPPLAIPAGHREGCDALGGP